MYLVCLILGVKHRSVTVYDYCLAKLFMHISALRSNVILPSASTYPGWHLNIHAFLAEWFAVEALRLNHSVSIYLFTVFIFYFCMFLFIDLAGLNISSCVFHYYRKLDQLPVFMVLFLWAQRGLSEGWKDGLMDRRFFLTFLFCSVSWIFFWEVRWKKGKESQIQEWLQGHSLSQYRHLFEGQWVTIVSYQITGAAAHTAVWLMVLSIVLL